MPKFLLFPLVEQKLTMQKLRGSSLGETSGVDERIPTRKTSAKAFSGSGRIRTLPHKLISQCWRWFLETTKRNASDHYVWKLELLMMITNHPLSGICLQESLSLHHIEVAVTLIFTENVFVGSHCQEKNILNLVCPIQKPAVLHVVHSPSTRSRNRKRSST